MSVFLYRCDLIRLRIMKTCAAISFLMKVINSHAKHQNGSLAEASKKICFLKRDAKTRIFFFLPRSIWFLCRVRWISLCKLLQSVCFAHSNTRTCSQRPQHKRETRNQQPEEHHIAQAMKFKSVQGSRKVWFVPVYIQGSAHWNTPLTTGESATGMCKVTK